MSCGCKNCNGAVSLTGQLPPGCDSILNIDTQVVEGNILVTITFCSGAINQFTIPSGQNGVDGVNGTNGEQGANGNGISDISVSQEGNEVTLTITLDDGTVYNETFIIQTATSAYIIDSQHFDTGTQIVLNDLSSTLSILATSNIPGNTIVNNGDTIHFDIVFRLSTNAGATPVFKQLYLSLGPQGGTLDNSELCVNLTFPGFTTIIEQVHIVGEMTKIESANLGTNAMNIKGTMTLFDKGDSNSLSHGLDGNIQNTMALARQQFGFYSAAAQNLFYGLPLRFQLLGSNNTYPIGTTINFDMIYFTTTKIPKL
jgi:hypothetical protein